MTHDFAKQKAETVATYQELQAEHDMPDVADVDYFFVAATEGADWNALADALSRDGFECNYFEVDPDDAEDGGAYLLATLPDQVISAEGIWIGEETATRVALAHDFRPDGWGLEA